MEKFPDFNVDGGREGREDRKGKKGGENKKKGNRGKHVTCLDP